MDAADMGVVEVDPAELARYQAKQKQTHNRYIQKCQAMMKKGSWENTHLNPRTPTWIGDADWDALMQKPSLRVSCGEFLAFPPRRLLSSGMWQHLLA